LQRREHGKMKSEYIKLD